MLHSEIQWSLRDGLRPAPQSSAVFALMNEHIGIHCAQMPDLLFEVRPELASVSLS